MRRLPIVCLVEPWRGFPGIRIWWLVLMLRSDHPAALFEYVLSSPVFVHRHFFLGKISYCQEFTDLRSHLNKMTCNSGGYRLDTLTMWRTVGTYGEDGWWTGGLLRGPGNGTFDGELNPNKGGVEEDARCDDNTLRHSPRTDYEK